ncbi:MAG: hypothetical protein ACR2QC_08050 [Gammaproteobacteria bacterium]
MPRTTLTDTRIIAADYEVIPIYLQLNDVTTTAGTHYIFTPAKPGQIMGLDFVTSEAGTGAGATVTFTPAVGGTAVVGGTCVVTLAGTSDIGEETTGAAITAGQKFTASQTVSIQSSSTTVFTAGSGYLKLKVEYGTQPN